MYKLNYSKSACLPLNTFLSEFVSNSVAKQYLKSFLTAAQVKFSEITVDMFRMVQVLEYQTEKSAINNVKVSSVEKNS